ncbi:MAG: cysteine--1-D-myo-inosityl 2-amino-2-deoxy-alpha-D-glucopyranoside ligase, partial [Actinocrinis sp.]
RERLADDLDSPGALAAVDAWADAVLEGTGPDGNGADPGQSPDSADSAAPGLVSRAVDALLGIAL